jgi:5,10-methylene-tetrahydrofolate dehydrogenase/methenyl tetrahydrofolate cyclohydrolase
VLSINQSEISNKEKDCQELEYHIASKELEKRKTENEIREKVKQLTAEKEKWRALCEQWEQAKFDATRLENLVG